VRGLHHSSDKLSQNKMNRLLQELSRLFSLSQLGKELLGIEREKNKKLGGKLFALLVKSKKTIQRVCILLQFLRFECFLVVSSWCGEKRSILSFW